MTSDWSRSQRAVLDRLRVGPATLAGLRAALPADDAELVASPSMAEPDPFGAAVTELIDAGLVVDDEGRYRLA